MGITLDRQGNLFISDTFNARVRRVDALAGTITTVAGNGESGFRGDGGPATDASLDAPGGLALDAHGNLFIADNSNYRIRRVDAATGTITTVAGNGQRGFSGDGGPATSAAIGRFSGVALDARGDLFLADAINNRVRCVDAATGIITTAAGKGASGYSGDGGPATSATLDGPESVAIDAQNNLFIADTHDYRLRRIDGATRIITTVAGNGQLGFRGEGEAATRASLNPVGVAVDGHGDFFIADAADERILRVDAKSGTLTTVAGGGNGGDDGPATKAILLHPCGIATDDSGNVFIADRANSRIRRIDAATGIITTVAGNGTGGFSGDGGPATDAGLLSPADVAVDAQGDLFIADSGNGRIRRVDAPTGVITTVAGGGRGRDGDLAVNAWLGGPGGVAVDAHGNLFIAEFLGGRVRRVDAATGIITTVAGGESGGKNIGDGGPATCASLAGPLRVAADPQGNLFVVELRGARIRRVDGATGKITTGSSDLCPPQDVALDAQGNVFIALSRNKNLGPNRCNCILRVDAMTGTATTVAGDGSYGFGGDGGPATSAGLGSPQGIAVDARGRLLIADSANNRVRAVELPPFGALSPAALSFSEQLKGTTSAPQSITFTNAGLVQLNIFGIAFEGANAPDYALTTDCAGSLKPGTKCVINATFTPAEAGRSTTSLVITNDAMGNPQRVLLSGTSTRATASLSAGSSGR
jgi:sugar lactone lactonase YvrE